jgi:tungstate transport system ATP-binding protein
MPDIMAEATADNILMQLEDLSFTSGGNRLISNASLVLSAHSRTIILGANGAGKSVLLRLMHGLLAATSGRVEWPRSAERAMRQAMVFQKPVLLRRSAAANVEYALKLNGIGAVDRKARALEALRQAGLAHLASRAARVLSGGEQQRLALARAWSSHPDVVFLDEPTASLDLAAAREVEEVIRNIHDSGAKIVMTTHNLGQARRLADEIVFIHQGRIAEHTPAEDFFRQPRSPEAAAFLKAELP